MSKVRTGDITQAALKREILRLSVNGQRAQDEANMRRFFLACALQKSGPITLLPEDIAAMKAKLSSKEADLKVKAMPGGAISLSLVETPGGGLASVLEPEARTSAWQRLVARMKLWVWGIRVQS
jgi:hypothetical protein